MRIDTVEALDQARVSAEKTMKADSHRILVCAGTGCLAGGSGKIYQKLKEMAEKVDGVSVEMKVEAAGEYHPVDCHVGVK